LTFIIRIFAEIYEILNSLPYKQELEIGPILREINPLSVSSGRTLLYHRSTGLAGGFILSGGITPNLTHCPAITLLLIIIITLYTYAIRPRTQRNYIARKASMQTDSNSSTIKHSGGITPVVLNLSTKWMKVVSFTAMYLHLRRLSTHQIKGGLKFGGGLDSGLQSLHRLCYPDYDKEETKSNNRILLNVDKLRYSVPHFSLKQFTQRPRLTIASGARSIFPKYTQWCRKLDFSWFSLTHSPTSYYYPSNSFSLYVKSSQHNN
jgi:hypothetical protein